MKQAFGLVAMRLYITQDEPTEGEKDKDAIPGNVLPFLRTGRPNLTGLVEQAVDEAVNMGRLGVATCGCRTVNMEVKNACKENLSKDVQDIYCHQRSLIIELDGIYLNQKSAPMRLIIRDEGKPKPMESHCVDIPWSNSGKFEILSRR